MTAVERYRAPRCAAARILTRRGAPPQTPAFRMTPSAGRPLPWRRPARSRLRSASARLAVAPAARRRRLRDRLRAAPPPQARRARLETLGGNENKIVVTRHMGSKNCAGFTGCYTRPAASQAKALRPATADDHAARHGTARRKRAWIDARRRAADPATTPMGLTRHRLACVPLT